MTYEHDPNGSPAETGRKPGHYTHVPANRWTYAGGQVIDSITGHVIAMADRDIANDFRPVTRDCNMRHIVDAVQAHEELAKVREHILVPLLNGTATIKELRTQLEHWNESLGAFA